MASKTEQDVIAKGVSVDVPPMLDPDMFLFWKKRFEVFVKSKSLRLWRIIESGDYVPRKLLPDGNEIVKVESGLAKEDETIFDEKKLAVHLLYSSIPNHVFGIIYRCETAHEIWKTLVMTYEGDSQLKHSKTDLATQNYENFQMLSSCERIEVTFTRFKRIVSNLKALGITYTNEKYVEKFLSALPANWSDIVKTLREDKTLAVLSLEDLLQSLIVRYSVREIQQRQQMFDSSMLKRQRAP